MRTLGILAILVWSSLMGYTLHLQAAFEPGGLGPLNYVHPQDVTVDGAGNFYASYVGGVRRWGADYAMDWETPSVVINPALGTTIQPQYLAYSDGYVYCNSTNPYVVVLAESGAVVRYFALPGSASDCGLDTDGSGGIYAACQISLSPGVFNCRIIRVDAYGAEIAARVTVAGLPNNQTIKRLARHAGGYLIYAAVNGVLGVYVITDAGVVTQHYPMSYPTVCRGLDVTGDGLAYILTANNATQGSSTLVVWNYTTGATVASVVVPALPDTRSDAFYNGSVRTVKLLDDGRFVIIHRGPDGNYLNLYGWAQPQFATVFDKLFGFQHVITGDEDALQHQVSPIGAAWETPADAVGAGRKPGLELFDDGKLSLVREDSAGTVTRLVSRDMGATWGAA